MKKYIYFFNSIVILSTVSFFIASAQTNELSDKIWSIVRIVPGNNIETKSNIDWIPAEQVTKFLNIGDGITVWPNFRPKPGTNTTQSETSVDVHPTNNNIVFCSANATNWPVTTLYGTGVYWSLNGSTTWTGYDNPPFGSNSGDPVSIIGADGRFYENYITNSSGQGVAVSTNNGVSWSTHTVAPNPGQLADKNHYMVDKTATSPFVNRSYCSWTDFGGANDGEVVLRYSTNFGQNWSSSINISGTLTPLGSAFAQGTNVQTGPYGEVYVAYAIYDANWTDGEDAIGFSKSTNGGASWTHLRAYNQVNFGIRGNLSSKNGIRVSSFPSMAVDRSGGPRNGWIYITWPQRAGVSPAGNSPDIVMIRSTDGGATWSVPVRVNNDSPTNGKDQYFPWCTVDQSTGQLMFVFYDSRDVPNNQANVYMARSLDGGFSFENVMVSDQPHTPSPIQGLAGGYAGDYIGVAAYNDVAYPYWGDNRTGNYQGWMAKVTFGPPCPIVAPSNPNPADFATNIPKSLSQLSWTNGAGTTQCEVWFGANANMTKVYDGIAISSWTISPPLNYNTSYNWQIIDKDATCSTTGPNWSFTTELSPGIVFSENFSNLNCWTAIGPLGTTNWSTQSTSNANGNAPELRLSWTPEFNGLSKLRSCSIPVLSSRNYSVNFKHMLDWFANPAPTLGLGVSYDNGATYTSIWSITPTGNVGPQTITAYFTTPPVVTSLNLVLYCNGNSYNIDYWYVDDILMSDEDYFAVADPTNVAATPINGSQINVSFTPNAGNNNVVIVWNFTGGFQTPSGTPPAIGQPFAGGTLLYNGTASPIIHSGLNPLTTYYYKLFSYDGANYSTGVPANATTFSLLDFGVGLLVYDNCANSVPLVFGTAPGATDCYDVGLDISAPPPPPPGAFDGRFLSCGDAWFTDIRGTNTSGERIWTIQYTPATDCSPVSFSWSPAQLPPTGYFHLVDPINGLLVNVNMRTRNSYTDVIGLGNLQIKYNYQICSNYSIANGWNMVSLPLEVSNNNYLTLFPNAVAGTLFGYSGTYYNTETMGNCMGYWLKFPSSQINQVCGLDRTECIVALNAGWNMIGGPNCNVPLSSVIDPGGIIIPGTLYGYSGTYATATSIDATKAYWIKASGPGTITISCGNLLAKKSNEVIISSETMEEFAKIEISDASKNNQTLYFSGKLNDNVNIESFSLPPVPPQGSFDARLSGDYRLTEGNEATILLQSTYYPISVIVTNLEAGEKYVMKEIANGLEVNSQKISEGSKILISNVGVKVLKIIKEQALPTSYNLEQNYPNPFNPSTTIKFSLPEASKVTLSIYNALGQKVIELVNTNLEAGWYSYQWDAGNIASGIYIYELRTDEFISTKKMILMK